MYGLPHHASSNARTRVDLVHAPETNDFSARLGRIGAELDRFADGRYGDALERREEWTDASTRALPDEGIGADGVVDELERGSVANLVALGAARQWALERAGIDPAADGLDGREIGVYTSTEAHHTVQRSAAVLGIGRANVRLIATDDHQRMDVDALREAMRKD